MSMFKVYTDKDGKLWIREKGKGVRFLCNCCSLDRIADRTGRSFKDVKRTFGLVRVGKVPQSPPGVWALVERGEDTYLTTSGGLLSGYMYHSNLSLGPEDMALDTLRPGPRVAKTDRFKITQDDDGEMIARKRDKATARLPKTPVTRFDLNWVKP